MCAGPCVLWSNNNEMLSIRYCSCCLNLMRFFLQPVDRLKWKLIRILMALNFLCLQKTYFWLRIPFNLLLNGACVFFITCLHKLIDLPSGCQQFEKLEKFVHSFLGILIGLEFRWLDIIFQRKTLSIISGFTISKVNVRGSPAYRYHERSSTAGSINEFALLNIRMHFMLRIIDLNSIKLIIHVTAVYATTPVQ